MSVSAAGLLAGACAVPWRACSSPSSARADSSSAAPRQPAAWQAAGRRRRQQAAAAAAPDPRRPLAARRLRAPAAAADPGYETDNDGQTVEQRLTTVSNMVATAEMLVPYDRSAVNLGLILWGAIRNIPHKDRMQLLSRLNSGDIKRLWKLAGQRYTAPKQQVAAAIGPDYSLWHDLPSAPGQLALFRGKAALASHALGISSFSKAFFLAPQAADPAQRDEDWLRGRVLLGKGPLGDWLYPLYFRARVGTFVVPTTQEPCDMVLEYQPPEELGLLREDLPRPGWPRPAPHLPPFHDAFTDYVRAVAPGVYVGLGYRTAATDPAAKVDPLYFLMVADRKDPPKPQR